MKKIICLLLFAAAVFSAFTVYTSAREDEENYIWILEASSAANTTVLADGKLKGTSVEYSMNMRYVSISGTALTGSRMPTRFTGTVLLDAEYDYSTCQYIKKRLEQAEKVATDGYRSSAYCLSKSELPDFTVDEGGSYMTLLDFHSLESTYEDSDGVVEAIGNCHIGMLPGRSSDHGYGNEIASINISVEPDEAEIGYKKSCGVRAVNVNADIYGSESEDDICTVNFTGTLKRIPYSPKTLYSVLLSPKAKQMPEIISGGVDGFETIGTELAMSRLKAYLSGGVYWPTDSLPASVPEFDDAEKYSGTSVENGVVSIKAICTEAEYDAYRKQLRLSGFDNNGDDYFNSDCYIKFSKKKQSRSMIMLTVNVYLSAKTKWLDGFEGIFPEVDIGCILKTPSGDSEWMSIIAYGADSNDVGKYQEKLIENGFKYDLNSYSYVSDSGYRYIFAADYYSDVFGKGQRLSFYITKEAK